MPSAWRVSRSVSLLLWSKLGLGGAHDLGWSLGVLCTSAGINDTGSLKANQLE